MGLQHLLLRLARGSAIFLFMSSDVCRAATCSTKRFCEQMGANLQECREGYGCSYTQPGGAYIDCYGGRDCRDLTEEEDCREHTNCEWSEPAKKSSCKTLKYCEEIGILQECRQAYGCSYTNPGGSYTDCYGGTWRSDCRRLYTQDDCEEYPNCGWEVGTDEQEGSEEDGAQDVDGSETSNNVTALEASRGSITTLGSTSVWTVGISILVLLK